MESRDYIALDEAYGAHNYHPLPVVIAKASGCVVTDPESRTNLDFLSAYSALSQGHLHPRIVAAAKAQLDRVSLTSRAFHNDTMSPFLKKLCEYTGFEAALPMNTGAEAVETAIKAFRVPYGDAKAVGKAIAADTVAVIFEPIQGEAGVIVPPEGYLSSLRRICDAAEVLLVFDEIRTGFCRTGRRFAWQWEEARPDIMCLGKALGGGRPGFDRSARSGEAQREGGETRQAFQKGAFTRRVPSSQAGPRKGTSECGRVRARFRRL